MLSFIAMMFNPIEPESFALVGKPTIVHVMGQCDNEMTKPIKFVREQSKL